MVEALFIRAKYMALSLQSFCPTTARKLKTVHDDYDVEAHFTLHRHISEEGVCHKCSLLCLAFAIQVMWLSKFVTPRQTAPPPPPSFHKPFLSGR